MDIFEKIKTFESNIENGINHNIYHIEKFNSDGVLIDECFGKNLMTDYGLSIITGSNSPSSENYWYITLGYSDSLDIPVTNHYIRNPIVNKSWSGISLSSNEQIAFPCEFDPSTNLISCRRLSTKFNAGGSYLPSTPVSFNEFGISHKSGTSQYLSFHSKLYDIEGNCISMDLKYNDYVSITMYTMSSINANMIKKLYDQGLYMFISPQRFAGLLKYGGCGSKGSNAYVMTIFKPGKFGVYRYNNNDSNSGGVSVYSTITNGTSVSDHKTKMSISLTHKLKNMYDNIGSTTLVLSKSGYSTNNTAYDPITDFFVICGAEKLSSPETLVTEHGYLSDTNGTFAKMFGNNQSYCGDYYLNTPTSYFSYATGELPVDDFNMESVKRYNFIEHDWSIDEEFINEPDTRYFPIITTDNYDPHVGKYCCIKDGVATYVLVRINTNTSVPLKSIHCGSGTGTLRGVLYTTDAYWDPSTWELVEKNATFKTTIDDKHKYKRYILMTVDKSYFIYSNNMLNVTYETDTQPVHRLVDNNIKRNITPDVIPVESFDLSKYRFQGRAVGLSSDEYGWFATQRHLVYPELNKVYSINETPNDIDELGDIGVDCTRYQTESGDKIVLLYASDVSGCEIYNFNNLRIYDTTNPDSEPTYINMIRCFGEDWSCTVDECKTAIVSWSEKGFLCVQHPTTNKCGIVDIYSNTSHVIDSKWCFALNGTSHCFYLDTTSSGNKFNVYDITTSTVIGSFTISYSSTITILGIGGWLDHMYVNATIDNVKRTYVYDLNTNTLKSVTYNDVFNFYGIDAYVKTAYTSYYNNRSDVSNDIVYIIANPRRATTVSGETPVYQSYILHSDPFTIHPFVKDTTCVSPQQYRFVQGVMLRYNSDGQLLYLVKCNTSGSSTTGYMQIFDMGVIIDSGGLDRYPLDRDISSTYRDSNGRIYSSCCVIYKSGLLHSSTTAYGSTTPKIRIDWQSSKWFTPFKITGTTKTVTAYNGSVSVTKKWNLTFTNDINKVKAIT